MKTPDFNPNILMRGAMTQTFLASLKLRRRGPNAMIDASQTQIINCSDGVRLLGSYSKHPKSKGLMIFLHGWEGSQDSTYVQCCGRYLYDHGYSVFRLNFRDHGESHHLNEGLFHGPQFDEVYEAVAHACGLEPGPAYVTGFSLGGNFGLRLVRACIEKPIENLAHVFTISPVINPFGTAQIADKNRFIRKYFVKKWTRSLQKKQALYPHLYNFEKLLKNNTVYGLSKDLIAAHIEDFPTEKAFYDGYTIWPDDLKSAETPYTIIFSEDDPVVPFEPARDLTPGVNGHLIVHGHGGHNGFFDSVFGPTWYDRYILNQLERRNDKI